MSTSGAYAHGASSVSHHQHDTSNERGISVAKPDLFYGDRDKVDDWLMQLQVYFTFQRGDRLPTSKQPLFATTYMRGNAQKWIKPYVVKYLSGEGVEEGIDAWMESFARFKVEVKRILGPSNKDKVAIRMIQSVKQKRSASEYTTQFKRYSVMTGWDDDALMVMFRRGLKDNVKDELTFDGAEVTTLDELISRAINIDDKLFKRMMEKRHDGGSSHPGWHVGSYKRTTNNRPTTDPYGYAPMELDTLHSTKPRGKGPANKAGRRGKALTCYACGKPGHMARDCRSKNKVHRQQLNTLDGDWNVIEPEDPTAGQERTTPTLGWDDYVQALEEAHQTATPGGEALRQQTEQEWDEEEDHSTSSEDRDEPASIKEEIPRGLHNYRIDPRNLQHGELAWRFCIRQLCIYHDRPRRQGGHSPFRPTCNEHWVNCKKDACEFHLWDK